MARRPAVVTPGDPGLMLKLGTREFETFCCLYLDNRHRLIEFVELFRGTIDGASVHLRAVVNEGLKHNAAAVIFAHRAPKRVAEASAADEMITRCLKDAFQLVDIRLLDHPIIAGAEIGSFTERRMLYGASVPFLPDMNLLLRARRAGD